VTTEDEQQIENKDMNKNRTFDNLIPVFYRAYDYNAADVKNLTKTLMLQSGYACAESWFGYHLQ
jgi:hypothetical protein